MVDETPNQAKPHQEVPIADIQTAQSTEQDQSVIESVLDFVGNNIAALTIAGMTIAGAIGGIQTEEVGAIAGAVAGFVAGVVIGGGAQAILNIEDNIEEVGSNKDQLAEQVAELGLKLEGVSEVKEGQSSAPTADIQEKGSDGMSL